MYCDAHPHLPAFYCPDQFQHRRQNGVLSLIGHGLQMSKSSSSLLVSFHHGLSHGKWIRLSGIAFFLKNSKTASKRNFSSRSSSISLCPFQTLWNSYYPSEHGVLSGSIYSLSDTSCSRPCIVLQRRGTLEWTIVPDFYTVNLASPWCIRLS